MERKSKIPWKEKIKRVLAKYPQLSDKDRQAIYSQFFDVVYKDLVIEFVDFLNDQVKAGEISIEFSDSFMNDKHEIVMDVKKTKKATT